MTLSLLINRVVARFSGLPAVGYGAVVIALLATACLSIINLVEQHRAILEAEETVVRWEHRASSSSSENARFDGNEPTGSPFLEGQTETIASAALLQRVTGAITRAGGDVVSSEVEPHDTQANDGFLRVTATCELEQKALQPLLYDIEAGMPFLFVNQLVAQAPEVARDGGRMRVVLEVAGLWPGNKSK